MKTPEHEPTISIKIQLTFAHIRVFKANKLSQSTFVLKKEKKNKHYAFKNHMYKSRYEKGPFDPEELKKKKRAPWQAS